MLTQTYSTLLHNQDDTIACGRKIAACSQDLNIIYLQGCLGAGKTTLTRGLLQGLGYEGRVKSPTYTLVESYLLNSRVVHHFDLYRIHDEQELEYIGLRDYFSDEALCLIEWPEHAKNILPAADLICQLEVVGSERKITTIGLLQNIFAE